MLRDDCGVRVCGRMTGMVPVSVMVELARCVTLTARQ